MNVGILDYVKKTASHRSTIMGINNLQNTQIHKSMREDYSMILSFIAIWEYNILDKFVIPDSLITFVTTTVPLSPACLKVRDRGI